MRERQLTAGELASRLSRLHVKIDRELISFRHVRYENYRSPAGRPTSRLELVGESYSGVGEYIGWTIENHISFREAVRALRGRSGTVGSVVQNFFGYERAAVEGAVIDLALKQAGEGFADWCTADRLYLHHVISIDCGGDPVARIRKILLNNPTARFKVDVGLDWTEHTMERLACQGRVITLDFKGQGTTGYARRLRERFPDAIFEDAPHASGPCCEDTRIRSATDIVGCRTDFVSLKAGRMGGVLELLNGVQLAAQRGVSVLFGGQFETGEARSQAQLLAALFAPSSPNDLASIPLLEAGRRPLSPEIIYPSKKGFGVIGANFGNYQ